MFSRSPLRYYEPSATKIAPDLERKTPSRFSSETRGDMIKAVLIINNQGKARFARFYANISGERQQHIMRYSFEAVASRPPTWSNIIEDSSRFGKNIKLVYRTFATLYFIFLIDRAENELAVLDLIHVFVESLDRCYKNVCELDIVFNFTKVHQILNEIVIGGQVLEVTVDEVHRAVQEIERLERKPDTPATQLRPRGAPLLS
ncbi:unnamed protein product [Closterium sp. Yama58-4]|nr:unnamed protein product [Closterium sp. Yama58-4]